MRADQDQCPARYRHPSTNATPTPRSFSSPLARTSGKDPTGPNRTPCSSPFLCLLRAASCRTSGNCLAISEHVPDMHRTVVPQHVDRRPPHVARPRCAMTHHDCRPVSQACPPHRRSAPLEGLRQSIGHDPTLPRSASLGPFVAIDTPSERIGAARSGSRLDSSVSICVHVMGAPDRHFGAMPHVDMHAHSGARIERGSATRAVDLVGSIDLPILKRGSPRSGRLCPAERASHNAGRRVVGLSG